MEAPTKSLLLLAKLPLRFRLLLTPVATYEESDIAIYKDKNRV